MNSKEQARFDALYQQHLTELKLQGLAPKTIDAYSRAVRRISGLFPSVEIIILNWGVQIY